MNVDQSIVDWPRSNDPAFGSDSLRLRSSRALRYIKQIPHAACGTVTEQGSSKSRQYLPVPFAAAFPELSGF